MPGFAAFSSSPFGEPMAASLAVVALFLAVFAWRAGLGRRGDLLREAAIVLGGFFVYFAVRGATVGDVRSALSRAHALVEFERSIGAFIEPTVQAAVIGEGWAIAVANWIYVWGHWPVIALVAFWLWRRHPARYRVFRNAFVVSGAIGLVLFIQFPTAPPRLAGLGLVDTLEEYSRAYDVLQPKGIVNQYAAFPSLHFGWNLLVGIALFAYSSHRALRVVGLLMPFAMLSSIVLTANHYWIDAAAGGVVALTGLGVAFALTRVRLSDLPRTRAFG